MPPKESSVRNVVLESATSPNPLECHVVFSRQYVTDVAIHGAVLDELVACGGEADTGQIVGVINDRLAAQGADVRLDIEACRTVVDALAAELGFILRVQDRIDLDVSSYQDMVEAVYPGSQR